ncbi:MAG: hydrogenase expression/formation protein HypE, partial [Desulfobaccales bacterium]
YGSEGYQPDDSAVLSVESPEIAFTTDAFVVDPLFFPGGDIGRLAVAGTVNDLLTAGARPLALAASFIIEEGFPIQDLQKIAASMAATAAEAGVPIATGDTKVVPRGSADGLFITTSGVGRILVQGISGAAVRPGDRVILTGSVGDHGATVMLTREKLLEGGEHIASDAAPLTELVLNLLEKNVPVHAMRDPTRGGVAAALNEIARQSKVGLEIEEAFIPVKPWVAAACEALGLDVLQVANEGKMLIFVAPEAAEAALGIIQASRYGREARIIGVAQPSPPGRVHLRTQIGTARILDPPTGELLPRIC